ncbi:AAA family ATPase [Candidatus Dojkabacteria bacterium]|uniref:AAA family ATPase n=1 Tax=Candidatus Dojkabacteria bacterium TaxID=2099670 RepID=A0A955RKC1_9BACT|nr:AAA family ATPase [Candidatus Dojkabacteria bacterium]
MQSDIFTKEQKSNHIPLADRLRPENLEEYVGQETLVGADGVLRKLLESDVFPSIILWGPPGVGKTTLARIIASELSAKFLQVSAVTSGKKDLQNVVHQAKEVRQFSQGKETLLFIDEIHRFNKIQQDYLLPFVEDGTIILIGATTENPSFEIIAPLLSRSRVFTLDRHAPEDLEIILKRGIEYLEKSLDVEIEFEEGMKNILIQKSNGDPRMLLNALEIAVGLSS